jgi:hypothetical protein
LKFERLLARIDDSSVSKLRLEILVIDGQPSETFAMYSAFYHLHASALILAVLQLLAHPQALAEDDSTKLHLTSPLPMQVIQRSHFDAAAFAANPEDITSRGSAEVHVAGTMPKTSLADQVLQYRITQAGTESDSSSDWLALKQEPQPSDAKSFSAKIMVPAGGWYRLDVRTRPDSNGQSVSGSVERFGVGEVFLVAGQSYATNTNEERLKIADSAGRVSALNTATGQWAIAHDPQPAPDGSDGGSIWPAVGDGLCETLKVPIGFANVAFGGTSSAQWLPDGRLHNGLIEGGKRLGRLRAVLWQQGESDVIAKTTVETYLANLTQIRGRAVREWGFEPIWLSAKSTHHPTVYNDPEGEGRIRRAIDQLSQMPGFGAGPDTDTLTGENRGDIKSRRHFSAIGQRRAAELWIKVLLERL